MWCFLSCVSQDLGPVLRRVRVSRVPRQDRRVSASISSGANWTVTTSRPTRTACSSAASWLRSPPSTSKDRHKALELQIRQEQRYPGVFDVTGVWCNILNLRKDVELKSPLVWFWRLLLQKNLLKSMMNCLNITNSVKKRTNLSFILWRRLFGYIFDGRMFTFLKVSAL